MEESISTLFNKYLEGRCSEAEIRRLLDHFTMPEHEDRLTRLILEELDRADAPAFIDEQDIDQHLAQVYGRIKSNIQPKAQRRLLVTGLPWYSYAAAAVVVIVAGFGTYYAAQKPAPETSALAENDIRPGHHQAILTLADGRKISLQDADTGTIAEQAGFRITKTSDGQLVYIADRQTGAEDAAPSYNTIEAPAGGQWQVMLPDRSRVWLNAMSSLTYPVHFSGNERKVELKGEAYFEVSPDRAKPFKVESAGQTVAVLGTHFNILAYADEPLIKTTLFEGSVKVSAGGASVVLKPGEQAQRSGSRVAVTNQTDLEEVIAWKNGYFKFNDNLEGIMSKIARWYNVEVDYDYRPDPSYTFSGKISRARSLNEVLEVMEYTGKVHFTIEERRIIVTR